MAATAPAHVNDPNVVQLTGLMEALLADHFTKSTNSPKGNIKKGNKNANGATPAAPTETEERLIPESIFKVILTKTFAEFVGMLNEAKRENKEEVKSLTGQIKDLKKHVVTGRLEQEKSQQYMNRDVIKFCGIPEANLTGPNMREDTNKTLKDCLQAADINLTDEEISVSHRLPTKEATRNGKPKTMLLKTSRRDVRNKIMRQKKNMRENQDFKTAYPDVFMVEHLTPMRSKVAYKLRHDDKVEKTWTIDGRIKVVMKNAIANSTPITIDSLGQLTTLPQLTQLGWTDKMIEDLVLDFENFQ